MAFTKLSSDQADVVINSRGAELHSFRLSASGEEYLWQGHASVWSGRAPILFPIIGALRHNPSHFDGKTIRLAKHGFVRHSDLECLTATTESARFRLLANADTLEAYPWKFELLVDFQLSVTTLSIAYCVKNLDSCRMPFNVGSHPAFRLPMHEAEHSDYRILFDQAEQLQNYSVSSDGLLQQETSDYALQEQGITLTKELFSMDALVFRHINSSEIDLIHNTQGRRVRVNTGGAPHLGIWAKPGAAFVCIEPWWGHADFDDASADLADKVSLQVLDPGEEFCTSIGVTIS